MYYTKIARMRHLQAVQRTGQLQHLQKLYSASFRGLLLGLQKLQKLYSQGLPHFRGLRLPGAARSCNELPRRSDVIKSLKDRLLGGDHREALF